MKPLVFSYDLAMDTITIEGVKYSGSLFRDFARDMPLERWFKLIERHDGTIKLGTSFVGPIQAEFH